MLKKIGPEIKILSFMLVIFLTVVITGILSYESLQGIVREVGHSSEPELKLTLVKEIVSDVSEAENTIKSYNLTRDPKYLAPFYNSILTADKNFSELRAMTKSNAEQLKMVEQMEAVVDEKYSVLNEMLLLYPDENIKSELAKISKKIEIEAKQLKERNERSKRAGTVVSTNVQSEKKGFFQRLFGNSGKQQADEYIADNSRDTSHSYNVDQLKRKMNDEIERVNREHMEEKRILKQKELFLIERSRGLMIQINDIFYGIEDIEQRLIADKIGQANIKTKQTNQWVAAFCVMAGLLLIIVSLVLIKYLKRKKAYEEFLKEGKNQAELLAHSKEVFLANMSHEIRTPMNAISGFTNQILKTELTNAQREQLKIVQRSNEHLLRIINDILDYSKMQAGKFSFEYVSFNPYKTLKDVIELAAPLIRSSDVKINYEVVERMPEFVIGDPGRLRQIVLNLLGNSIKFTEKGEISVKAGFTKLTNDKVQFNLELRDTGIGIPQAKINEVFEEFQQADAHIYHKYGGTGLGLPITKKLVELQNGTINIESKEEKGTTIRVTIPYTVSTAGAMFFKDSGKPVFVDERFSKTLKVLIADDDEYNRKLLNVILCKWNVNVKEAKNGKEVVEEMMKDRYDILLMDIRMPEMNGIEAAEKIRKLKDSTRAETPIIALSAVTTEEKKQRCKEAGINDFLAKPFKEEDLFKKIVSLTGLDREVALAVKTNLKMGANGMRHEKTLYSLDELRQLSNGDETFVKEMIMVFVRTTTEGMAEIEKALRQKNYNSIAENAHKICPPCRHMGAIELAVLLKKIEDSVRKDEELDKLEGLIAKARTESNKVIQELKNEMKDTS